MQRLFWVFMALALVLAFAPARAFGQLGTLSGIPGKSELSEDDKAKIKAYLQGLAPGLQKDPQELKKDRDLILKPLLDPKVTITFRLEYASALVPFLQQAASSKNDFQVANALRIAGELGTASVVDLLLEALKDPRPSIRYAATFGIARLFEAVAMHDPAVTPQRQAAIVQKLAALFVVELDAKVLDGIILALESAISIPPEKIKEDANFRWNVISALAKSMAERFEKPKKEGELKALLPVMLRGVTGLRNAATLAQLNLPAPQKADIVKMCDQGLAAIGNLRKQPEMGGANKAATDQLEAALKTLRDLCK